MYTQSFFSNPYIREGVIFSKAACSLHFAQTMVFSGNSYNKSSDSDDNFDESNHRYEGIMLRAGQYGTKLSGANGW